MSIWSDLMKKSIFNRTYLGKPVEVTSRMTINNSVETPEGVVDVNHPVTVIGFLIAIDKDYYHLGDVPKIISQSIKKEDVAHIALVVQKTMADEILDKMPVPAKFN